MQQTRRRNGTFGACQQLQRDVNVREEDQIRRGESGGNVGSSGDMDDELEGASDGGDDDSLLDDGDYTENPEFDEAEPTLRRTRRTQFGDEVPRYTVVTREIVPAAAPAIPQPTSTPQIAAQFEAQVQRARGERETGCAAMVVAVAVVHVAAAAVSST